MNALHDHAESRLWTVPNLLTGFRIVLAVPFLYLIKLGWFGTALLVFFVASITDFFDGYAARRLNQHSTLGRLLDPLADKLLTTAGFVVMAIPRAGFPSIPVWLAIAVVGRDAVILIGSLVVYLTTRYSRFRPSILGKINTFLELGLIIIFLGFNSVNILTFLLVPSYWLVLVSVVVSGLEYVIQGVGILAKRGQAT